MEKLISIVFMLMLVGPGFRSVCYSQAAADEPRMKEQQYPKGWKKLAKYAPIKLKFTHRLEDVKEYNQKPTIKQFYTWISTKTLILDMKSIKKALEESGIIEPVIIQLRTVKNSWILAQLGKYTPNRKKGKVVFPMPETKQVVVMQKGLKHIFLFRLKNDLPLDPPEICMLVFKNAFGIIKAEIKANCYFPFEYERPQYEKLDRLLAKEQYEKAEMFCARQKGEIQNQCYRILGDVFFQKEDYPGAALYYEKIAYKKGFDKIGLVYLEKGDYAEAVKYFVKGTHSADRARAYAGLADYYWTQESDLELAEKYYTKAIDEYEYLIKDYHYVWNQTDSDRRRRCIRERKLLPKTREEHARQQRLRRLLEKASAYCDRLYNNFFHFFCREVITEYIDQSRDVIIQPHGQSNVAPVTTITRKYIYEYQLIKEDKDAVEWRTLLKENGIKRDIKNAQLLTRHQYEKLIFGPIAFLSKFWQRYYDYKILREDNLMGERVVVIEAIPKEAKKRNSLVGNIWVKEDENSGFDVLKLEWNPKTILENFEEILRQEKGFKGNLSYTFFAEFNIKREGFRLPSRYFLEEAYVRENKRKKFVRVRTEVIFKEHRYFSVSTEVIKSEGKIK